MKAASLLLCFLLPWARAQQPVTNDTLIKLTRAGIAEDLIVAIVNQQPGRFSVADSDITALKNAGVAQKVIATLIAHGSGASASMGSTITLYDSKGTPVQLAAAANSLNPAPIVLPAKTGPVGGVLMTNGQSPQHTVWATLGNALMVAGNTLSLNTAVVLTDSNASAGKPWYCKSAGNDAANTYTCSVRASASLTAYTEGMFLLLNPNAANIGSSTLNVDGIGAAAILQKDGTSQLAPGELKAGQAVWVWYDGQSFRLMY